MCDFQNVVVEAKDNLDEMYYLMESDCPNRCPDYLICEQEDDYHNYCTNKYAYWSNSELATNMDCPHFTGLSMKKARQNARKFPETNLGFLVKTADEFNNYREAREVYPDAFAENGEMKENVILGN